MQNTLYEKDYSLSHSLADSEKDIATTIFNKAIESGFFAAYSDAMRQLPKIVNPVRKANFDYVQNICDRMAQRWGGKIRSEIRYDKWDAIIDLTQPFVEFGSPEDLKDMKEISQRVDSCTFSPAEDGGIRMHIFCYYFDDVATQEEIDEIISSKVKERPELMNALWEKIKGENNERMETY